MAFFLRIRGSDTASCCSCSEQVGCDCSALPCGTECRHKGAIATLCGFSEFTSPSNPPKKYRQRRITGDMVQTDYPFTATCVNACNGDLNLDWVNEGGSCVASGGFAKQSETATHVTYVCTHVSFVCGGVGLECFMNAGPHGVAPGDTVTRAKGVCWDISIWVNSVTWHPVVSGSVMVGQPDHVHDTWAFQGNYNVDTCALTQTDGSVRTIGSGDPFPIPCVNPFTCYPTAPQSIGAAERVVTGGGCNLVPGAGSADMGGDVFDILEQEDTEDDAKRRAKNAIDWTDPGSCAEADQTVFKTHRGPEDFSFAFRDVQFRVTSGTTPRPLVIGHVYKATVRFGRRPLGSGLPYMLSEVLEIEFIAGHTIETTNWIDMTGDPDYETKLLGCKLEDITA
jgi:hypothetical protein